MFPKNPVKVTVTVELDGYSVTTVGHERVGSHSVGFLKAAPGSARRAGVRALNDAVTMLAGLTGDDEGRQAQLEPEPADAITSVEDVRASNRDVPAPDGEFL